MLSKNDIPLEHRTDLGDREKRLWRSLVRVESVDYVKETVGFVIPGWNVDEILYFNMNKLPENILCDIKDGMNPHYRFHAKTNFGAIKSDDIYIDLSTYEK